MPNEAVPAQEPSRPLRVAIVGAGKTAVNHARAIGQTEGRGTLMAVAEPSETARERSNSKASGPHAALGALLAAGQVDVLQLVIPSQPRVENGADLRAGTGRAAAGGGGCTGSHGAEVDG